MVDLYYLAVLENLRVLSSIAIYILLGVLFFCISAYVILNNERESQENLANKRFVAKIGVVAFALVLLCSVGFLISPNPETMIILKEKAVSNGKS